uniref:Uncharacterized protein n=1 Tax=Neospora caninum (strain Liverpool) TaxID=572307 RepID=A0A0F7UQU5_NEOCL|nr:TPA: hypothetical protein BN1204_065115 [Neospora caninum Liverpool]
MQRKNRRGIPLFLLVACAAVALQSSLGVSQLPPNPISVAQVAGRRLPLEEPGERGACERCANTPRRLGVDEPGQSGRANPTLRTLHSILTRLRSGFRGRGRASAPVAVCPHCARVEDEIARDIEEERCRRQEEDEVLRRIQQEEADFWRATHSEGHVRPGDPGKRESEGLADHLKSLRAQSELLTRQRLAFQLRRYHREQHRERQEAADSNRDTLLRLALMRDQLGRNANRAAERNRLQVEQALSLVQLQWRTRNMILRSHSGSAQSVQRLQAAAQALRMLPVVTQGERRRPGS